MKDNIINHINTTLSILDHVPDQYKGQAFEIILNHLLGHELRVEESSFRQVPVAKSQEDIRIILKTRFDWTSIPILSLKPTPQILLVMKIVKENFDIHELSANDLKMILMEKFRIQKSASAISMLLMEKLGKYVDRISEGKRFYYRITENGVSFVESELRGLNQ